MSVAGLPGSDETVGANRYLTRRSRDADTDEPVAVAERAADSDEAVAAEAEQSARWSAQKEEGVNKGKRGLS
jgi:hypothetical protein